MRLIEMVRALLLLLAGFACGAQLGAGPVKEIPSCKIYNPPLKKL